MEVEAGIEQKDPRQQRILELIQENSRSFFQDQGKTGDELEDAVADQMEKFKKGESWYDTDPDGQVIKAEIEAQV